jgi:hypothetical protein
MSTITEQVSAARSAGRPGRHRRAAVFVAATLVVASIGTAWAWTARDPEQTTRIQCPDDSIIAAVSGDPVADCADAMRGQGLEPPTMTAYVTENGGVVVVAEGETVAPGLKPAGDDFQQDIGVIELEAALSDVTTGLDGGCYTNDEAVTIVERELAHYGYDWTVETRDDPDGLTSCAWFYLEPERQAATVVGIDDVHRTGDEPWAIFGAQLHGALDATCLSLEEAADAVDGVAADVGIDPTGLRVTTTNDDTVSCTRATVTVGGVIFVDLRGPQS